MYADYAKIAREEGFHEIAHRFEMVADVEKRHDNRYQTYIGQVKEDTVFHKAQSVSWICLNCGYICESKDVPKLCPICSYPQDYFEPYQK